MIPRKGEWLAFSSSAYCRKLTLYGQLEWEDDLNFRALSSYHLSSLAPSGGWLALLEVQKGTPYLDAYTMEGGNRLTEVYIPNESHTDLSDVVEIFNSAGRRVAHCLVETSETDGAVGDIISLSWTNEMSLCVLTNLGVLFVFSFSDEGSMSGDPERMVRPRTTTPLFANPTRSRVFSFRATGEGVLVTLSDGCFGGVLFGDGGAMKTVEEGRLVRHTSAESNCTARCTAMEFIPPQWNDQDCLLVYWGETVSYHETESRQSFLYSATLDDILTSRDSTNRSGVPVSGVVLSLRLSNDMRRLAVFTSSSLLLILSSDLDAILYGMDFGAAKLDEANGTFALSSFAYPSTASFSPLLANELNSAASSNDGVFPEKMEWCGDGFLLVHYNSFYTGGGDSKDGAPYFSVLLCVKEEGEHVRFEKLDWSVEGSGHIVSVAEVDGVRIMTDTCCYLLQECPPCLIHLCRLKEPFSLASQFIHAYELFQQDDWTGLTMTRSLVAQHTEKSGHSEVEAAIENLMDCASYEPDVDRQLLFLNTATFVCENGVTYQRFLSAISDVARRIRVLSLLRDSSESGMPLTIGQYAYLAGMHPSQAPELEEDGEEEQRTMRCLTSVESRVLMDRLCSLQLHQLALRIAQLYNESPGRIVTSWAASTVSRSATMTDEEVFSKIRNVFGAVKDASYLDAAAAAIRLGRKTLSLQLLHQEKRQSAKVCMFLQSEELLLAARTAAHLGDSEALFVTLNALVHQFAPALRLSTPQALSTPIPNDMAYILFAVPELLACLVNGALWEESFSVLLHRLFLVGPPANNLYWPFAYLLTQSYLRQSLIGSNLSARKEWTGLLAGLPSPVRGKEAAETIHEEDEQAQNASVLPSFHVGKPSLPQSVTYLQTYTSPVTSLLEKTVTLYRQHPELPSPMEQLCGTGTEAAEAVHNCWGASSVSLLSDQSWFKKEAQLQDLIMELVSATGDERFTQCASVMDVVQRIAEHNPQDRRIDQLKKTFNLTDTAVLVATVKGAIVGRRLSSMTSLVGPPPPLSKPSFFQRSKIPTVAYRVMVETLLENGLREEAASYVPGIAQDPGCRVEWYLRIGAPIMAIEAGYEGEAPLLIETVMRKFPHHPKVQQEGEKYLRMLGGGG